MMNWKYNQDVQTAVVTTAAVLVRSHANTSMKTNYSKANYSKAMERKQMPCQDRRSALSTVREDSREFYGIEAESPLRRYTDDNDEHAGARQAKALQWIWPWETWQTTERCDRSLSVR